MSKETQTETIPDFCYGLLEIEMADTTYKVTRPIIIRKGHLGYWRTDWEWTKEFAREALKKKNALLGISSEMAARMEGYSMFGWPS